MIRTPTTARGRRALTLVMFAAGSPSAALAAGPVYFDIGGLAQYAAGLVLLLVVAAFIPAKSRKRGLSIWGIAVGAYVLAPIVISKIKMDEYERTNAANNAAIAEEEQRLGIAFKEFCRGSEIKVRRMVNIGSPVSIEIQFGKNFIGNPYALEPARVSGSFSNPKNCPSSVSFWEGSTINQKTASSGNGTPTLYRRYANCAVDLQGQDSPENAAPYVLIIGDSGRRLPWQGRSRTFEFSDSSIRLIERATGDVLAEDTIYFLDEIGDRLGCVRPQAQIKAMTDSVLQLTAASKP